jgi:hypothetical protein
VILLPAIYYCKDEPGTSAETANDDPKPPVVNVGFAET